MVAEASASPAGPEKPSLVSRPSVANERQAKALAELKALCEDNKLYWPASEIDGYPAEGHNDDSNLLYVSQTSTRVQGTLTYDPDGFSLHDPTILRLLTSNTAPQQPGAGKLPSCKHMTTRRYKYSNV